LQSAVIKPGDPVTLIFLPLNLSLMTLRKTLSVLLFVLPSGFLFSQQPTEDKAQLEKERQEIQNEIREIQGIYDKIKGQKKQTIGQMNLLQRKINLQNKYISNINRELRYINDDIFLSNVEIYRMQRQLDTLKAQYGRSVVYAYKNRSNYDFLNFIFSAGSFNDALKRMAYLKSYRAYREQQVANIKETQLQIENRKQELLGKRKGKDDALKNQTEQVKVLDVQKKEQNSVVSTLKTKEKELEKQLATKRKRDQNLKNALAAIVRREIEEARKKAAAESKPVNPTNPGTTKPGITTKPDVAKSPVVFNTAEDLNLNESFETNRNRLPWPVDQGYVCIHFGPYQIGDTKLRGDNPGITICTPQSGVNVKSVFEGEVVGVFNLSDIKAVTIRHGKYFTTYSNLSSASVTKGTKVKTGQSIGKVAVDEDDGTGGKLEFLLMIETRNVNPESWLRK
jgi:septal ring factor EnvC (AmiA/AmiB activator)